MFTPGRAAAAAVRAYFADISLMNLKRLFKKDIACRNRRSYECYDCPARESIPVIAHALEISAEN